MFFQSLAPLLTERSVHVLFSSEKEGRVRVHVQPAIKDQKEDEVFVTPFTCVGTPQELDAELPGLLVQWVSARANVTAPLREALAAAEQALKANAEKAANRLAKQAPQTTKTTGKAATQGARIPSLPNAQGAAEATNARVLAQANVPVKPVVTITSVTSSLFD